MVPGTIIGLGRLFSKACPLAISRPMDDLEQGGSSENPPETAFVSGPAARLRGGRSDLWRLCAKAIWQRLDETGLDQFEALLTAPDQDVYAWLRGGAGRAGRL